MQDPELRSSVPRLIFDVNEIDNVHYAKRLGGTISSYLTWNKHVENVVAKAGKRVYIKPVLEYACPVWHTNLNRHLTESIETVQKRALKCIYHGNTYANIWCLPNLPCLKERRDSLCKNYFQK